MMKLQQPDENSMLLDRSLKMLEQKLNVEKLDQTISQMLAEPALSLQPQQ